MQRFVPPANALAQEGILVSLPYASPLQVGWNVALPDLPQILPCSPGPREPTRLTVPYSPALAQPTDQPELGSARSQVSQPWPVDFPEYRQLRAPWNLCVAWVLHALSFLIAGKQS
jgi:hypothetical protein